MTELTDPEMLEVVDIESTILKAKDSERARDFDSALAFYSSALNAMKQKFNAECHFEMTETFADYGCVHQFHKVQNQSHYSLLIHKKGILQSIFIRACLLLKEELNREALAVGIADSNKKSDTVGNDDSEEPATAEGEEAESDSEPEDGDLEVKSQTNISTGILWFCCRETHCSFSCRGRFSKWPGCAGSHLLTNPVRRTVP
jgi:hypothetical protein